MGGGLLGAMLHISEPGPHGGVQQAIVCSTKEYTSTRASWRRDRVGTPPPKPTPKTPPPPKGGRLTSKVFQKHAEDPVALDQSKVAAKCLAIMNILPVDVLATDPQVHLFSNFAVATCNLAGWHTVVEPDCAATKARLTRCAYAFKMF